MTTDPNEPEQPDDLLDGLASDPHTGPGEIPASPAAQKPAPEKPDPIVRVPAKGEMASPATSAGNAGGPATPPNGPTMLEKTQRLRRTSPRQFTALIAIGVIAVVAIIAVIVLASRDYGRSRTTAVNLKPATETSDDVDVRLKVFMDDVKDKLPNLTKNADKTDARLSALEKRIDDATKNAEQARVADSRRMDDRLAQIQRMVETLAPGQGGKAVQSGDFDGFVSVLAQQKARTGLSLSEARLRLETWLKTNGFADDGLALMRDRALDRLGFIYVGDVAEPPLTDQELAQVPESLRGAVRELAAYLLQSGQFDGKVVFREEEALKWMHHKLGEATLRPIKPEVLKKAVFLARVRKEAVTHEQEEVLPDLAAKRDAKGIAPTDVYRTEAFIFEQKARWPAMTPGQHLSMTMALAGLRANAANDLTVATHAITGGDRELLAAAARDAAAFAYGQGIQAQEPLLERARKAVKTKATDLKVVVTAQQVDEYALTAVAAVLKKGAAEAAEPQAPAAPADQTADAAPHAAREKAAPAKPAEAPMLHLGPLALTREHAAEAALITGLIVADRLHLNPTTSDGAASLGAIIAGSPSLGRDAWQAVVDRDQDLRTFANQVVQEDQELIARARTLTGIPVSVVGMGGADAAFVQAVELGRALGAERAAERPVQDVAIKNRQGELAKQGVRVALPADATGWKRLAAVLAATAPGAGLRADRLGDLMTVVDKQLTERKVAHEQLALPGFARDFVERIVRDLDSDLVTSIPAVIAEHDDGRITPDMLGRIVVAGENRYAVAAAAEAVTSARGMQAIAEKFASLFDSDTMIPPLYQAMARWIPDHIHATLEQGRPEISDTTVGQVAVDTANSLTSDLNQFIVKSIIANNLDPRLKAHAGSLNAAGYQRAMDLVRSRLEATTVDPLTVRSVDELTMQLHQQALAAMDSADRSGGAAGAAARARPGQGGPNAKPGFFDVKDEGLPGLAIGSKRSVVDSGKVVGIPRGSAMHVYLEIGTDTAIKSENGGIDRVQLRSRGGFFDPTGHWYQFPPCILQGRVKPNPGGDRNMVEIDHIVTVVHGIEVDREMSGIVTDEEDGIAGMKAQFLKHYDKIIPEAAELAIIEGTAQGLASTQQTTTVVVPGATTQSQNTGSALQYGIGSGLQKGVDILAEYQKSYIDKLSPTMKSPNGQKLVAQFFSTVDFPEVTEADWRAAAADATDWNGF